MTDMRNAPDRRPPGQRLMKDLIDPILRESGGMNDQEITRHFQASGWPTFSAGNLIRWRAGDTSPTDINAFRTIATATGKSLLTVLDVAGLLTKEEQSGIVRVEVAAEASVEEVINADNSLTDDMKRNLIEMYGFLLAGAGMKRRGNRNSKD